MLENVMDEVSLPNVCEAIGSYVLGIIAPRRELCRTPLSQIPSGRFQSHDIILHVSDSGVAQEAQNSPHTLAARLVPITARMVVVDLPLLVPTTRLIRSANSAATALLIHHTIEIFNGDPVGSGIPVDLFLAHDLWLGTTDLMIRADAGLTPLVTLV
jgi:hypothetical protein